MGRRLLPFVLVIGGVCLLYHPALLGEVFHHYDLRSIHVPYRAALQQATSDGRIPLWTPLVANGFPLHAESEGTFFAPFQWPFLWAFSAVRGVSLYGVAMALVGAFGMMRLGRMAGFSAWTGAVLGIAFAGSGALYAHLQQFNYFVGTALLPWVMVTCWMWRRRCNLGRGLLATWVLATLLLSGHPQTVFHGFLVLGVAMVLPTGGWVQGLNRLARGITIALASAALAAVQLLPTLELVARSARSGGLPLQQILGASLPPTHLLLFINPFFFGRTIPDGPRGYWGEPFFWELCGYVGLIPLVLGGVGMWHAEGRRWRWLRWLTGVSFVLALGRYGGLIHVTGLLPGFSLFRIPGRYLALMTPGLLLFAGWTLEHLGEEKHRERLRRTLYWLSGVLVATLVLAWLGARGILAFLDGESLRVTLAREALSPGAPGFWQGLLAFGTLGMFLAILTRKGVGLVAVLVCLDLTVTWSLYGGSGPVPAPPPKVLVDHLREGRYLPARRIPDPTRGLTNLDRWLSPDANLRWGLATPMTAATLKPPQIHEYLRTVGLAGPTTREDLTPGEEELLALLGVRYLVGEGWSPGGWKTTPAGDALIAAHPHHRPGAFLADGQEVRAEEERLAAEFERCRPAYLRPAPARMASWAMDQSRWTPVQTRFDPHRIVVEGSGAGLAVLQMQAYPGWRWTRDGVSVDPVTVYGAYPAFPVPGGPFKIEGRYGPDSWRVGLFVSLLALLANLGVAARSVIVRPVAKV